MFKKVLNILVLAAIFVAIVAVIANIYNTPKKSDSFKNKDVNATESVGEDGDSKVEDAVEDDSNDAAVEEDKDSDVVDSSDGAATASRLDEVAVPSTATKENLSVILIGGGIILLGVGKVIFTAKYSN